MRTLIFWIIGILILLVYRYPLRYIKERKLIRIAHVNKVEGSSTESALYFLLQKNRARFIEYAMTQSFLETGNYKSPVCVEGNNYFGIRYNSRPFNYKKHLNHAAYKSMELSVKDYCAWQKLMIAKHERFYNKKIITPEDYEFFLENLVVGPSGKEFVARYAEDPDYIEKIKLLKRVRWENIKDSIGKLKPIAQNIAIENRTKKLDDG